MLHVEVIFLGGEGPPLSLHSPDDSPLTFAIPPDSGAKSSPDSGHPNDADDDDSKTLYENLPFHGMPQQQQQQQQQQQLAQANGGGGQPPQQKQVRTTRSPEDDALKAFLKIFTT